MSSHARTFHGFDHIDTRVRSLAAVEQFYDRFMPELGLPRKEKSFVDEQGEWHLVSEGQPYNTVEYQEAAGPTAHFIGFIEDPAMKPVRTRIAFRVTAGTLQRWHDFLQSIGARNIEWAADMTAYPALFFEDPAGTRLELVAR